MKIVLVLAEVHDPSDTDMAKILQPRPLHRTFDEKNEVQSGTSAVDRITAHIKENLRLGRLAPGQRLVESDLQEATGASRGSIREALKKLASDGMVELHFHRGARVRQLRRGEVESLYDIREVLEGLAARLAARHAGVRSFSKQAAEIEAQYARMQDGSARTYMSYNESLHRAILDVSQNRDLVRIYEQLQIPTFMLRLYAMIDQRKMDQARRQHQIIVDAIVRGNEDAAENAMRAHIRSTKIAVINTDSHFID